MLHYPEKQGRTSIRRSNHQPIPGRCWLRRLGSTLIQFAFISHGRYVPQFMAPTIGTKLFARYHVPWFQWVFGGGEGEVLCNPKTTTYYNFQFAEGNMVPYGSIWANFCFHILQLLDSIQNLACDIPSTSP